MTVSDLYYTLTRADKLGINLPTLIALTYTPRQGVTTQQLKDKAGNQAWKCATTSPLFDVVDNKAYLSEKGEAALQRILRQ
jgi:hypothetical protein